METYDYIIAGGGCAGLSLAYYLHREGLDDRRVLIIDRDDKQSNDRTWCFWSNQPTAFDSLIHKRWDRLAFADKKGELVEHLGHRRYQMLRSIDFYRFIHRELDASPQIERRRAYISVIQEDEQGPYVIAGGHRIRARYIFDSCHYLPKLREKQGNYHFLLQHFQGWTIHSNKPVFDPGKALLMDFRTAQHGAARFFYVLPLSKERALVEYTLFSAQLLPKESYDQALRAYITGQLQIQDYQIEETEGGAIPMTDMPFPARSAPHIINIGTQGGAVKPTTGYAFLNIQKQTRQIARQVLQGQSPAVRQANSRRFAFYDTLLLRILQQEGDWAAPVFSRLFRRNSMYNILTFLEEKSNLWQEAGIFASLPLWPFIKALAEVHVLGRSPVRTVRPEAAKSLS